MKVVSVVTALSLSLLLSTSNVMADTDNDASKAESSKASAESSSAKASTGGFSYRPPMRGAPAARIGGGTRGIGNKTMELIVLAPDHTGLTTREQPTLYWYSSEPVEAQLEVTLINDESIDPQLEQKVSGSTKAGIHGFDLSTTSTRLKPGLEYRWFVSVIADDAQRSNDIVASGTIQRIVPDKTLNKRLVKANMQERAGIYAESGIWYDTIDTLSRLIEESPDNTELQKQRATLLEQVGLETAAN
jgi:hypothetical protein